MKPIIITLLFLCGAMFSAGAGDPSKMGLKINISGRTGLEGEVRSYLKREFRAIDDIEVREDQVFLAVNIVVLEVSNKTGQSIGYTMSIAVTDKTPIIILGLAGATSTDDPEKQKQLLEFMPENGILVDHILQAIDRKSLDTTCKQLAARIDGTHLENARKLKRGMHNMIENQPNK